MLQIASRFFGNNPSKAASLFKEVFKKDEIENDFLDSLILRFVNFDEYNADNNNKVFSSDVKYIASYTVEDFTSKSGKSLQRIDAYFYVYHRLVQYSNLLKEKGIFLQDYQKALLKFIGKIFSTNEGRHPNLSSRERETLKQMNIIQHLSSITITNEESIATAFALFKLSIQASAIMNANDKYLTWKYMLPLTAGIRVNFEEFIDQYKKYQHVFQQCSLNPSAYIYLIQLKLPRRNTMKSPFVTYFEQSRQLMFDEKTFFQEFAPAFADILRNNQYNISHVNEFLVSLSSVDHLFSEYLAIYASNVMYNSLWLTFLSLSRISTLNSIIQKHLTTVLTRNILSVSLDSFKGYINSAKDRVKLLTGENRTRFVEIFEQVYDAFISKEIRNLSTYSERDIRELMNIDQSLVSPERRGKPMNSAIIQQLLFRIDPPTLDIPQRLMRLFQNISEYNDTILRNSEPRQSISDENLKDWTIIIPQMWLKIDENTYRCLCNHQNNKWAIYIWSRIVNLSVLKVTQDNLNNTLVQLNDWLRTVRHEKYNSNDILTIIVLQNLFELLVVKHTKFIVSLPNIELIIRFAIAMKDQHEDRIIVQTINSFISKGGDELKAILNLKDTRALYNKLLTNTVIHCFLPYIKIEDISSIRSELYQFPAISDQIDAIISLPKPRDLDKTIRNNSREDFFKRFVHDLNQWFPWFDRFFDVFQPILDWLKTYNIDRVNQLALELSQIKIKTTKKNVVQLKELAEEIWKILQPFKDLERLCHLFNCLISFHIIEQGMLNNQVNIQTYISELERCQPTNKFHVEGHAKFEHKIPIQGRQNVRWSLVSVSYPCTVKVEYRTDEFNDPSTLLYEKSDVHTHKNVLQGQFETEKNGQLIITINNQQRSTTQIWYRLRSVNLSTCHLFTGILRMIYDRYFNQLNFGPSARDFSKLVDETFCFVDKILDGDLTLKEMTSIQTVFCNKNIYIKDEVEKLFTSRSREQINPQQIEQVCEWLQIYQYYSHITIIIDCVRKFDILANENEDETISHVQLLGGNDNCTLRDITQAYRILQERFRILTPQHLQLIRTAVECSNVVQMIKKEDLYSDQGRSRFQKLRDNLTTQFQFQERNNMILNSWIITDSLLKPFMYTVNKFDEFLRRIADLVIPDDSSLNHIKIINDNLQIVKGWLKAENTTVLDNALIIMENLYQSGGVDIRLRHLINEPSYFEITYSINQNQDETNENKQILNLSMADIDDHKRQLAFCNVDVQQNRLFSRTLVECQLELLQKIEKIYLILKKLEMSGHPDFQLREEHYDIFLYTNQSNARIAELEQAAKQRTESLDFIYKNFHQHYIDWMKNIENSRQQCCLLKLFSDRQIMILIILLQQSPSPSSIRRRFLNKLYAFQKVQQQQNDEEQRFAIQCLRNYLSAIRIQQKDQFEQIYERYQIDANAASESRLKKLADFLNDLYNQGAELMAKQTTIDVDQQYLIPLTVDHKTLDINTFCILINLLNNRLPSSFQILWCTTATNDDIKLFFSRIRQFRYLIFLIVDIDEMHHRQREFLLNEQDCLTREQIEHGTVFYFSKELTTSRNGLRTFGVPNEYRRIDDTSKNLRKLFNKNHITIPSIKIVCGAAGIGKTHQINTEYQEANLSCLSINNNLNLSSLIRSFLLFDSQSLNHIPLIYFNISLHAPFPALNRTLFSLFICGSIMDSEIGLIFSLPNDNPWNFVVEVPHSKTSELTYKANCDKLLPLLSIITPKENLHEVTSFNYRLHIGEEEELVARFLKAYEDRTIDRLVHIDQHNVEHPVVFDRLINDDECRRYIDNCMTNHAPGLPRNKISELSFTKFLYRRTRFFTKANYQWNQIHQELGSTAMKQMIEESRSLAQINFRDDPDPYRVFLVYDPEFHLHILHNDWNRVSPNWKKIFANDPRLSDYYKDKDYLTECLAWLIDIPYEMFDQIARDNKFILTENFAYKLFHVHERKLTRLPLIIEGNTGVGKTFLLKFYSVLLHAKNTRGHPENMIVPRIAHDMNIWLNKTILPKVEKEEVLLKTFVHQSKRKILGLDNNNENNLEPPPEQLDLDYLNKIKQALKQSEYNEEILFFMWKSLLTISNDNHLSITKYLLGAFYEHVSDELTAYRLIEPNNALKKLLEIIELSTIQLSIDLCKEYLFHCKTKPIFHRSLIHPGITEQQIVGFMSPIIELARELSTIELVVFFDEVNTSTCLGLFKEMFMDGTLHGRHIPKNIFFTAAINPYTEDRDENRIHRTDFNVYQLPESLQNLVVPYGALASNILGEYISKKITMFQVNSSSKKGQTMHLEDFVEKTLENCILAAQKFCEDRLGTNTVSQREIQRCFNLIEFFWRMRYDDEVDNGQITSDPNPIRCIALSIALIYYFRLPTKEHIEQKQLHNVPSREELTHVLSKFIPNFDIVIQNELLAFVNTNNFLIPAGVAINQAVREHIFAIVVSIITRTPLGIIGEPGQSKTLSFQIVVKNLQGQQLSPKLFCKRLPAVDPFYCLGSKYTESDDIAYVFERAIKREQHYEQNGIDTRCVVFLDEASLPNENRMVLKVLHPYLDDCKVAFVAIANQSFDAANANRMICVYRSLPSREDQKILAYGCLGLDSNQNQYDDLITSLCQGYRRILQSDEIPKRFHDRDFIYMLRELRFELTNTNEEQILNVAEITPQNLLHALENNFNGIKPIQFQRLVEIFFRAASERCSNFQLPNDEHAFRDIPTVLRQSMKLDSKRRKLYGRYKLIIDESDDESAVHLLFQSGILDSDTEQTMIFRMSDFPDDTINELRNVEMLSKIKLCMETGKTILMVNTGRIHGALYDVFNQNFSIMATDETRKIFSKVAIGPKTMDVVIHENFQCIVHIKEKEFKDIPAPFLSRFQKYILNINDFYSIYLKQLSNANQQLLHFIEQRIQTFIQHFGRQHFYGLNDSTLYSCLLSLIKKDEHGQMYLTNIRQNYSQLTIKSKSFIEQNTVNDVECFLYYVLSQLTQLVSPESMIYKLRTLEKDFARLLYKNYFTQQEHFDIEKFINQILSYSNLVDKNELNVNLTRKFMLFTRTSAFITSLNEDQFQNSERIMFVKLAVIENSAILNEQIQTYVQNNDKQILIIIIDGRIDEQRLHISFLRQLIDKTDQSINKPNEIPQKYFLIFVHSTGQELNYQSCFPAIFLHNWDYYFLDTSTSGSAIHLQKLLQVLTLSYQTSDDSDEFENINTNVCDYNQLFNDCLWDFCSRLKVSLENLPKNMFSNPLVQEFYQQHTSTHRRFECLQKILQQSTQLQERIVNIYYTNMTINQKAFDKMKYSMYQLSKDVLCGKRTNSLVDSFQSQTRAGFIYFISNILKCIVSDYGLETLSKLSDKKYDYEILLNLIDYSTLSINDDDENKLLQANQGCISLRNNYSCVLQTPLYSLLHQRIKTLAEQIKPQVANEERGNFVMETIYDDNDDDEFFGETVTTIEYDPFQMIENETETIEYTSEQFRDKLIELMLNDRILHEIVSDAILKSYTNDTVRTCCTVVEESFKNYNNDMDQYQNTIDFVTDWLLLIDDNDQRNFKNSLTPNIWLLAHVYTFFKYDSNDLLSLYSACRTLDQLDSNQTIYDDIFEDEQRTRISVRENIFHSMFDSLWTNLSKLCLNNESPQSWIQSYTFISKYYPSNKVLEHQRLTNIKGQLEFMNLAYLIFLNNQTSQPKQLIQRLLNENRFDGRDHNFNTSICLKLLPAILKTIEDYLQNVDLANSTLMIDVQQWILAIVKPMNRLNEKTLKIILEFLDQSNCQLSLSMKQYLFDETMNLLFALKQQDRVRIIKPNPDFWDRLVLLPTIIECVHKPNLQTYQLPYHPSVITDDQQKQILFDLFFFHLRRLANNEMITCQLLNTILMSTTPIVHDRTLQPMTEKVFQQLKDFFSINLTGLLFSEKELINYDQQRLNSILNTIIQRFLTIDAAPVVKFSSNLQLFLSTIIIKRSWNYLLNLLKSERFQLLNSQWSNTLHDLLQVQQQIQQRTPLQTCHRLQFTLTTNTTLSIFPKLHQPYDELSKLIFQCSKTNDAQRWKPFIDWIKLKLTANPIVINAIEIKVMLLLNIYYDYYCTNQLATLENLLDVIEANLQVLDEERRVFRAFLQPEQSMEGYPRANNNLDNNQLNNLFKLDYQDEDDLNIRHALVNLLAMILLAGRQNFLWTFTFQPLTLQNTFGFGSTAANPIEANGVHYDCGCVLTEAGDLQQYGGNGSALSVPSVYVAYFSTFGAMALHLLLFKESVNNLYHPVLAKHAIDDTTNIHRMVGDSIRAKVCHFVRARLISTYSFLSIRTNESDACMLLNRCFEQLTNLTKPETGWIRTVYIKIDDKRYAEQEYQNRIFYPTDQQIVEYKQFIANLYLQSQIQQKLQEFLSQMPIIIQFQHFKTELCNPKYVNLPLNILRRTFNSFAFLRMTHLIYDLGQFYLLLHQTYSQLIQEDEFEMVSLRELIDRGQQRLKSSNRLNLNQQHQIIVDNGIKAVNVYHSFSDGLIRPGACDERQRFQPISIDTSISYLVTTKEHDEGDIIRRIMSILIDYHNDMLNLLEQEINSMNETHGISLLKDLINQFSLRQVSIHQILEENTGVISINDQDRLSIECLSRSNLDNTNEYFLRSDTTLNFNFLYIQYYLIRSYFLLCPINYEHLCEPYRCLTQRSTTLIQLNQQRTNFKVTDPQFEYLQTMSLENLYQGYKFLEDFLNISQVNIEHWTFYDYLKQTDKSIEFFEKIQFYKIKDFQFSNIETICNIYRELINNFHHSILNSSHLLSMPISFELNQLLDDIFRQSIPSQTSEQLNSSIRLITEFLDDLSGWKEGFIQKSSESLMSVYIDYSGNTETIFKNIPREIKCENYISVIIKLIEIRSRFKEKTMKIEESFEDIWRPIVSNEEARGNEAFDLRTTVNVQIPSSSSVIHSSAATLEPPYTILFEFNLELIRLTSSYLFDEINNNLPSEQWNFTINYPDQTIEQYSCQIENLQQQLRANFQEKNYDFHQFTIVDRNHILIDLNIENPLQPCLSDEYYIIERNSLNSIEIEFDENIHTYFASKHTRISALIKRFLHDNEPNINLTEFNLAVFDQLGVFIKDDQSIEQYSHLKLVQYDIHTGKLSKLTVQQKNDFNLLSKIKNQSIIEFFERNTTWKQISRWIENKNLLENLSIDELQYWNGDAQRILDNDETISSIAYDFTSVTIDGFTRESLVDVRISYNNEQKIIRSFKSTPINQILPTNDCVVSLVEEHQTIKLTEIDREKSIGEFWNTDDEILHFRISTLIKLIEYDTQEETQMTVANNNLTIEELLKEFNRDNDQVRYLALDGTNMILSNDEQLINQKTTKFFILKQEHICEISINGNVQRFIKNSMLEQVYEQNQQLIQDQYLVYENHFIFSPKTSLELFRSPIEFTLTNQQFPINVIIMNETNNKSCQFHCQTLINIQDVNKLAIELLQGNDNQQIVYNDKFVLSEQTSISLLRSTSPICFNLIKKQKTIRVEVSSEEQNNTIHIRCLPSVSLENLRQLACQLFDCDSNELVYEESFILSQDTFNILLQRNSSLRLVLVNQTYPSNITITKDRDVSITFQCQSSIFLDYLRRFACQIFHLNFEEYYLKFSDETIIQQYDISLDYFTQSFENIQFELIESVKGPHYTPLFQLNTQAVRLIATDLFRSLSSINDTSGTVVKVVRFDIVHPDATRQKSAMAPKNVYKKLSDTFQEKKYSSDQYVIVDQEKIFVNFLSEISDPSTMRFSTEYYIVEKVELINVIVQFQSQQMTYSVTSECQISSILTRFLTDKKIVLTSSETFLGFFDQLGSYIINNQSINQIYRSNQSDPIRIKIRQYENENDNLWQVSLIVNQDELQIKSFHPLTTLQEISQWLRISDQFSDQVFIFYDHEQQIVLDENKSIATVSSTLNGIANNEIITVHLSYEDKTETTRLLKSISTSDLLYNEHYLRQLNVQIPSNECILVRMIDDQNEILSDEDLKKSLEHYSSSNHTTELYFRIAILIQIIQYDNNRLYSIPVPSRNLTIEKLIQKIPNENADTYKYLSSFQRHVVLLNNENLSNFNETKFHLINAKQICSISINDSQNTIHEKYANFATIEDIYKQNQGLIRKNSLGFKRNFVLASDTSLTCFQHFKSAIDFSIDERNLPAHITISKDEPPDFILKFHCLSSISIDDISELVYQLFNVRQEFYQLIELDGTPLEDGSLSLDDLINPFDDVRLKLISKAQVRCLVTYDKQTIIIPANNETKLRTIFEESLEKFLISNEYMNNYEFSITDTRVDLELSASECLESFDIQSKDLSIELINK